MPFNQTELWDTLAYGKALRWLISLSVIPVHHIWRPSGKQPVWGAHILNAKGLVGQCVVCAFNSHVILTLLLCLCLLWEYLQSLWLVFLLILDVHFNFFLPCARDWNVVYASCSTTQTVLDGTPPTLLPIDSFPLTSCLQLVSLSEQRY